MEIKADIKRINDFGTEIIDEGEELKNKIINGNLLTSIEGIRNSWKGADAVKLLNVLETEYIKQLETNIEYLINFGNDLSSVSKKYDNLDSKFASIL